jgi:hypothetical protein
MRYERPSSIFDAGVDLRDTPTPPSTPTPAPPRATPVVGTAWGCGTCRCFFLVGTEQYAEELMSVQGALFFVALFPLSYLALFVPERLRGGVWAAVLLHAGWNFADAVMPNLDDAGVALETGIMLTLAGLTALAWRSVPWSRPVMRR